ncbi:unnamed protein product [Microthlaspi erraticum]|uniref:Arabidopsis retrotransposon Orf1 C-terminal domain-containing protein n=1 Tax=Microthlaspi erraticum TaxID=1685480 RepID=A0A6D2K8E4_9BRAS|nr:unnamed protein product [Microthlaspi erraticum]
MQEQQIPTSPHSIDANQEHVESPRGEDDWALVTFVGEKSKTQEIQEGNGEGEHRTLCEDGHPTLDLLKIRDDVTWYLRKLGLSKLFKIECSEYSMLTKEFLSTVALAFPNNNNGDQPAGDGLLLFKIGDANGRISSQLYANSLDFPMRQHMTSRRTQRGNKLPLLIGHTLPMNHSCLQDQRCLESLIQPFAMCTASSQPLSMQTRSQQNTHQCEESSSRLGRQQEALCRFGRLITAIVQHVGIDIPNYEPLPKPIPLDLHALQQIHFLNRWTQNPTKFCYEFPIGPTNTSLVLLPHETSQAYAQVLSLSSPRRKTSIHQERNHHSPSSHSHSQAQRRHQERHVLSTGMAANQALDRVSKLEKMWSANHASSHALFVFATLHRRDSFALLSPLENHMSLTLVSSH